MNERDAHDLINRSYSHCGLAAEMRRVPTQVDTINKRHELWSKLCERSKRLDDGRNQVNLPTILVSREQKNPCYKPCIPECQQELLGKGDAFLLHRRDIEERVIAWDEQKVGITGVMEL